VPLWPGAHQIDVEVGHFYQGASTSLIEVHLPDGSAISGSGLMVAGRSAGTYATSARSLLGFAIDVTYRVRAKDASPPPPTGHVEVFFRSGGRSYVIKSDDIDLLGVSTETPSGDACRGRGPTCIGRVDSRWTARLLDITSLLKPTTVGGKLVLQVAVTDRRDGSGDSIGITLWDGDRLLFSSAWSGAQTLEQVLKTGDVAVN
jgi:hypothetical protein